MSVPGGMLLSKDAIADVVEALQGPDFYRPAHQVIFDCILDLYGRGEPADAITVAAELNRTDQLSKMGGAVYLHPTMDELDAIASRGGVSRGVPTGIRDLDELTNGLQAGQMIVIAARPGVGKSTLGLDIARSCSVRHHLPAAIFSLEMSKHEITMRLLSAEAKVPLHHMRAGSLSDEDWSKLARRMGEIADAPLYIDDSPNMTMMEIRAKARRLKQRNDLKLVVIDYLQLMTSGKKV